MKRQTSGLLRFLALGFISLLLSAGTAAAKDLVVAYWGSLYYGAPYAVALEKGYFKANHVDVTGIINGQGGGTTIRNMMVSDFPYTESALAAAIEAKRSGLPVKIVNTAVDTLADFVLITRKGGPVHSVKDLKGRTIGYTSEGSVSQMAVLLLLNSIGLSKDDVHLVAAGGVGAVMTGIQNGTIDAGWTGEPLWSKQRNDVQVVAWLKDVMDPHFTQMVGVVNEKVAREHPKEVSGIIRARAEGVKFIYEHPDEAAKIIAKAYGADPGLTKDVVHTLAGFHYWSDGKIDIGHMDRMVQALRLINAVGKGKIDLKGMIDESYLKAAEK